MPAAWPRRHSLEARRRRQEARWPQLRALRLPPADSRRPGARPPGPQQSPPPGVDSAAPPRRPPQERGPRQPAVPAPQRVRARARPLERRLVGRHRQGALVQEKSRAARRRLRAPARRVCPAPPTQAHPIAAVYPGRRRRVSRRGALSQVVYPAPADSLHRAPALPRARLPRPVVEVRRPLVRLEVREFRPHPREACRPREWWAASAQRLRPREVGAKLRR